MQYLAYAGLVVGYKRRSIVGVGVNGKDAESWRVGFASFAGAGKTYDEGRWLRGSRTALFPWARSDYAPFEF